MDTESLTFRELAERLGVKLESARKTVLRKRWQKITGNDGMVRIQVPIEALPSQDKPRDSPSDSHRDNEINALSAHVESLREQLTAAGTELAELRPLPVLVARLEAEAGGRDQQIALLRELVDEMKRRRGWVGRLVDRLMG